MRINSQTRCVVTGGASGLGEAAARALAGRGASVAILDVNKEKGEAVAESIGGFFVYVNLLDETAVDSAVAKALDLLGGLHIIVNAAGEGLVKPVVGRKGYPHSMQAFSRNVAINLLGTFSVSAKGAAAMIKQDPVTEDGERGVIINVGSVSAFHGQEGHAGYSASKAGVVGMTLPMARDLARHGIRVNCVVPGLIKTPMSDLIRPERLELILDAQTFPIRPGKPEECAALMLHIIENPFMNAEIVRLDAGFRIPKL
ncbi:hypothetical protein FOZ61_011134 [Perkinsus olseni]|uniref:3-hydroxyacyl-CoA dehydrogenase type-2 n=1 Tax=Perkinsus olseni TaxID=32597 RepID=A0A7J6KUS6_PEROL|nr:hypothetical protein FOL46_001202 [Perkinsus olseni]KAF4650662.1 hypothetical protein FOZ61_011134 [Perkinsus olseni]